MDKIALSLLAGLLLSAAANAECPYSFDAHPTQLAMYSLLQEGNTTMIKPLVITVKQQFSISLPDVPQKYMTSSRNGIENLIQRISNADRSAGDINIPSKGILAIEFKIDRLTQQITTKDNYYQFGMMLYGSSTRAPNQANLTIELSLANSAINHNNEVLIKVVDDITTQPQKVVSYALDLPLTTEDRLGLYFNQDTGRLGAIVNGKDKGYISQKIPKHIDRMSIAPFVRADLDPTNPQVGEMVAGTVITDASQMKLRYPKGTRDICGLPLR
jgi:hypothetical protein